MFVRLSHRRKWKWTSAVLSFAGAVIACTATPPDPKSETEAPPVDEEEEVEERPVYPRPGGCFERSRIRKALPPECPPMGGAGGMGGSPVVR